MAARKPLVMNAGRIEQLQAADTLDAAVTASTAGTLVTRNYIANPDAESATTGWATYADAAAATPVDGTGGSPSITWTRSTSGPIRGTAHFLLTKGATNRQGDGVSYDFTLDTFDSVARIGICIEFDVVVSSGTFVTGDLAVFLYDVTGTALKTPYGLAEGSAPIVVQSPGSLCGRFRAWLPAGATIGPNMRLAIHVASTSAAAYTIAFDNFSVSPINQGEYLSEWTPFTPSIGAVTTAPTKGGSRTELCYWRRNGMRLELNYHYEHDSAGSAGSGTYKFLLPCSFAADTAKLVAGTQGGGSLSPTPIGYAIPSTSQGSTQALGTAVMFDSTNVMLWRFNDTANAAIGSASGGMNNGVCLYSFQASIPVAAWA